MTVKKYTYMISDEANLAIFQKMCAEIEKIPHIEADALLEDVDGSLLRSYHHNKGDLTIYNAYYFDDEVRIDSTFELEPYLGENWFLRKV